MKKVLALVLAVIMVCTMAMAVDVTTTTTPEGTSAGPYAVAKPGTSLEVTFNEATDGIHFYQKDGKFVPANNVVTVTFAKGGELVASQGWVKTGTGDAADAYHYFINLKQDLNRVADTKVADIQISAITFKSTGYDLVKVFAPTSAAGYKSFAYGYNNVNVVLQEDGTVSFNPGEVTTIASLLDKNGKEVNNLNVKLNGMTYSFVKGQKVYSLASAIAAPTTAGTPAVTYQNLLNTTAKVVYEKGGNADTTYRVYDFDRRDDQGNQRELHIQQSLEVLNLGEPQNSVPSTVKTMQLEMTCLTSNAFFTVYKWKFSGLVDFKQSAPYLLCSVLSGNGTLTVDSRIYCLKKGDHFLLPNNVTDWEIDGQLEMIVSHPNEA